MTTIFFIPRARYDLQTVKQVREAAAASPLKLVFPKAMNSGNPQPDPPQAA